MLRYKLDLSQNCRILPSWRKDCRIFAQDLQLTELDLAIVNALQIRPRAPWTVVAAALGVDAVTVARRWERLHDAGLAWVTVYPFDPAAGAGALIEIDCAPGRSTEVAQALACEPCIATVEHTAGSRDLLITVLAPDFAALAGFTVDRLGTAPGVTGTRTHLYTRVYRVGASWRLASLDHEQHRTIEPNPYRRDRPIPDLGAHRDLILALGPDGRMSFTDLAMALGVSVNTARRRLTRLLDSGRLVLRCDAARSVSGSPLTVTLWADVPPEHLDAAGNYLAQLPQVRACLAASGTHNLLLTVWLHSLHDAHKLEQRLAVEFPHLRIVERAVALRTVKIMGRLLDSESRAIGFVPLDVWAEPPTSAS